MKKFLQLILRYLSIKVLNKYNPQIVGITGSMGKTSTKEAVFSVLSYKFDVRKNLKNYNNEIGVPLTILGLESGKKSLIKWLMVFLKALKLILIRDKNYPEILTLEMGADHPGDIKYLVDFVPCNVGVITSVAPVHIEFFGTLENVSKEKGYLIESLAKDGVAVLNYNDERVRKMKKRTKAKVITYGFKDEARLNISEFTLSGKGSDINGMSFKLTYNGDSMPVFIPSVLGVHQIFAILAGAAVGTVFKMSLDEIVKGLKNYKPPKGRMNLIQGIKDTLIIDDTYNASPKATLAALETLGKVKLEEENKKFAVLADMLELGDYTEEGHREVGEKVAELGIDCLVTVGEKAKDIAKGAEEKGMDKSNIFSFSKAREAGLFLQNKIEKRDILLVKGSQGMRMEKVVKELMAKPLKACDLLVRQGKDWECR